MLRWSADITNRAALIAVSDALVVKDCHIDFEMYLSILEMSSDFKIGQVRDMIHHLQQEILRLDAEGYFDKV